MTKILTTYDELATYNLGRTDVVACTCGRHDKPFIALDIRAAELFREFRRLSGGPRMVVSSTRCVDKQADLYAIYNGNSPVATARNSTHVALVDGGKIVRPCVAVDVRNDGSYEAKVRDRDLFRKAGENLWGKRPRIGWESYGFGCVHADVAFFMPWSQHHVPGAEW